MQVPLQITFRDIPPSPAIEARIREQVERLERFHSRMIRCRVVVESPHRHHHKGHLYHVGIEITVPGGEIVVNREAHEDHSHEDAYVAVRDAFMAAGRQLEDYARKQRGDVKVHPVGETGFVTRVFPADGYGFIETIDGRQVYFHKNSVIDGAFGELCEGSEVTFVAAEGESPEGPQATTVRPVGRGAVAT